ncbi:hypothetical protein FRB91_006819 [Serendipita sp. 411]|nr:hypothetical protein FRC19_002047 [Serendipita sp. 401]KAG8839755.1 hypothetical protein FRB91_006819 [Serendipita sp. 411]KAG9047622.1 hypothetical protein FS842_000624 [Serendipita sp. 407]
MVKIFSQTHRYDDAWPTVTLAYFLRYPNRYALHVISADVLSRKFTPSGTLVTTRLILKRGILPAWFPRGLMQRSESWIVEESEVDLDGKVLTCRTRNLDHVKIVEVVETTELRAAEDGTTIHKTEARFVSSLGWGLKKRIEEYSANKFKSNIEKSRLGLALVVRLLREAKMQSLNFGNRMTSDGSGWSSHDIHAAAVAPPSSIHASPRTLTPNESAESRVSGPINPQNSVPDEPRPKTRQGWAGWLWSSERDNV